MFLNRNNLFSECIASTCSANLYDTSRHKPGADPGAVGNWGDRSLKPTKVTLFTIILYNSENNICDARPFCRPLFCHRSAVKYTWSLLQ